MDYLNGVFHRGSYRAVSQNANDETKDYELEGLGSSHTVIRGKKIKEEHLA